MRQSGRASPGAGRKARWRLIRRSEFVTVPDFSPHPAAGNSTSASFAVSVSANMSDTATKGVALIASRTASASGIETAGLVDMTQRALISPRAQARNRSTAFRPGFEATAGARQCARTASRCAASSSDKWLASMLDRPPTSRPPIALGCPVTENGPMPGRPIRPAARWQLMIAFTLSTPEVDWFTPCEKTVTIFSVDIQRSKNAERSDGDNSVAVTSSDRAATSASGRPSTCCARYLASSAPRRSISASKPLNSATSEPGARARCRSAISEVAVRRGSMFTTRMAGRAAFAAAMRW